MRPVPTYILACILLSFLCIEHAVAQCPPEVHYSLQKTSENTYSIFLKAETTTVAIKIQLYDLLKGKLLEEKEINSLGTINQQVFRNIPPSRYAIILRTQNCDKPKTLGGINGIGIGIPD